MNERFAAEPNSCINVHEFRYLLERFGPYAGRYLAAYPNDWSKQIEAHFSKWGELEQARAKTLLRRAKEGAAILNNPSLAWDSTKTWVENAIRLMTSAPKTFDGVVVSRNHGKDGSADIHTLDEIEWPPTADERIVAVPEEYVRVTRTLLIVSSELVFIDPYLNPCKRSVSVVMERMLQVIARGKCQRLVCWARTSNVIGYRNNTSLADIDKKLHQMFRNAAPRKGFVLEFLLVDDKRSHERMHGRYVLSLKGGVKLDRGFQELTGRRKVDVGPVGRAPHEELMRVYMDGQHDIQVDHRLELCAE